MKTIYNTIKRIFRTIAMYIVAVTTFLMVGCTSTSLETLECSLLIDVTGSNDHTLQHLKASDIQKVLGVTDKGTSKPIIYRQSLIADTFINRHREFTLSTPPSFLTGNSFDYRDKVKKFLKGIENEIALAKKDSSGRGSSSIYLPMARELRRLSNSKSGEKLLILYTDLIENTEALSFFNSKHNIGERTLQKLIRNPKAIEIILQREMPLPKDLNGITVYIIHDTQVGSERYFKPLLKLYQSMLEKRGAVVISGANL